MAENTVLDNNMSSIIKKEDAIPNIRFSEFTEIWEKKQLKDFMQFKNGLNADKDKFGSGVKFISVMDILNNPYITYELIKGKVNIDSNILKAYSVTYGDVLFQRSSETRLDAGKSNVYLDKNNIATFGGFVIRGRKNGNYNPEFMNSLLKTNFVRKEITSKAQGAQHFNVGQETLENVVIFIPALAEQEKIASFLTNIDNLISAQESNLSILETYNRGLISKIFKQEIRFKDDNGNEFPNWIMEKVKNLFEITRGCVLATNNIKTNRDQMYPYPVYSSQTKNNGLMGYYDKFLYENAITWTTDGANAGTVNFREGKFYCTNVCGVLLNKDGYANKCIAEIIGCKSKRYVSYVGNPKLMNNVMAEIPILIPCLEEQEKISNFLISLDNVLQEEKNYLEQLKTIKKGLLQQMFV